MIDTIRWLVTVEAIGLAVLPLTFWFLHRLPDRGFIFAKIFGLVVLTYLMWLGGNVLPIAGGFGSSVAILVCVAFACWGFGWRNVRDKFRGLRRVVVAEELIFVIGLVGYAALRVHVFGPAINHTEQFMDMALLNSAVHSSSYPPQDPWMSGHGINYYYFGYLMFATVIKISSTAPAVGYNLSLAFVCGFTLAACFSLGYGLTGRLKWSLLSPIFVMVLGNWHALLWQLPHGQYASDAPGSAFYGWLWQSTRVIGNHFTLHDWSNTVLDRSGTVTINEFPLFSLVLGDLHPHVMSLMVTLLAVALGLNAILDPAPYRLGHSPSAALRLTLTALCTGVLFTVNSWDFPTFSLLLGIAIFAQAFIADASPRWWRSATLSCGVLALGSVLLFTPFYVHFRSLSQGIGVVVTPTTPYELLQVLGFPLLIAATFVAYLNWLLAPEEEVGTEPARISISARIITKERGSVSKWWLMWGALGIIFGALTQQWSLLFITGLAVWTGIVLQRVLLTEIPNRSDAFALLAVLTGLLVTALPEMIYLRDVFAAGSSYRMNTVFKFQYESWVLLGLAAAYGIFRIWNVAVRYFPAATTAALTFIIAFGVAGAATYTQSIGAYSIPGSGGSALDGSLWLRDSSPTDFSAIQWLQAHAAPGSVIVEAVKGDYDVSARVSTFTGLPSVMGWAGHENQWRLNDPEIQARVRDVNLAYTAVSWQIARHIVRKYHVRYVVVGAEERQVYGRTLQAKKFARFMRPVFKHGPTSIFMD